MFIWHWRVFDLLSTCRLKDVSLVTFCLCFKLIQLWFHMYCLAWALKKIIQLSFRFSPFNGTSIDYLLQLLKSAGYQEFYLFFKSVKYFFLSTAALNQQFLITCSSNSLSNSLFVSNSFSNDGLSNILTS